MVFSVQRKEYAQSRETLFAQFFMCNDFLSNAA